MILRRPRLRIATQTTMIVARAEPNGAPEKKLTWVDQLQAPVTIVNGFLSVASVIVSFAAAVYSYSAFDRAKKVEEVVQAKQRTALQALELGSKSAFNVQSESRLTI